MFWPLPTEMNIFYSGCILGMNIVISNDIQMQLAMQLSGYIILEAFVDDDSLCSCVVSLSLFVPSQ
jgi:hypothetical protein